MTDMDRYEQQFAERLRAYSAPAARPPRREAVTVAVAAGRETRGKARLGLRWPTFQRLSMVAAGALAVVLVALGALVLANLPRSLDLPPASLPKSPADWLRVELELPPGVSGIGPVGAGPRGLVAVTEFDRSGARRVLYSSDGRDWAEANIAPPRGEYVSVVATERGFLMTDSESGAWSSENGVDWQLVAGNWAGDPDAGGAIVVDAAAGGPGYVAVGNLNKIWHSTDGSTWVEADVPPPPSDFIRPEYPELTVDLLHVAAFGEKLAAAGYVYMGNSDTSITEDVVLVSNDGKTWSTALPDIGDRAGPLHVSVGPNGFLVIGGPLDGGTQYSVWQSADGETWQKTAVREFNASSTGGDCTGRVRLEDVAATSAGYLAVGIEHECMDGDVPASPPRAVIWTSEDGRSWSRLADDETFTLPDGENSPGSAAASVVAWDSRFVVSGMYAGAPTIWISGSSEPEPTPESVLTPAATANATDAAIPSLEPTSGPPTSGGMWPQTTLEEVRAAQEAADAGDSANGWQLGVELTHADTSGPEIIDRFISEELGWQEYRFNPHIGWQEETAGLHYVKCSPGETNSLYPLDRVAGQCAPTLEGFRYETVSIDLAQPIRSDPTGIWVVSRWALVTPFIQSDPTLVVANGTARLEQFLEARIAGDGAEGYVQAQGRSLVFGGSEVVPLLYGTSTGAPYESFEVTPGNPSWPYGDLDFDVRLFAAGGESYVDQPFSWREGGMYHDRTQTTENGEPIAVPFEFFDGTVVLTAPRPWEGGFERDSLDFGDPFDLNGATEEAIILVNNPRGATAGCAPSLGLPDANDLAASLQSDPDLEVTDRVNVSLGGYDGIQLDVVLGDDASQCEGGSVLRLADGSNRRGASVHPGSRMRVYLFDMPEGSFFRTLGIAVVAPEARFEAVLDAAGPVLDSLELLAP